ncbi:MAG: hypothetical protein ACE361_27470 [Aureliella sp.]
MADRTNVDTLLREAASHYPELPTRSVHDLQRYVLQTHRKLPRGTSLILGGYALIATCICVAAMQAVSMHWGLVVAAFVVSALVTLLFWPLARLIA